MFERIIIATDLSESSYELVSCLEGLQAYGAKECLLLQCLSFQQSVSMALSYSTSIAEKILQDQKEILEKQGFEVETRLLPGSVKNEINQIAVDEGYSLIVVGLREYSRIGEMLFGGLAYEAIHHALKPVLIIRIVDSGTETKSCLKSIGCGTTNHVLFPTDFSENAELAFSYVREMVKYGVKKVTLCHIQDKEKIIPYLKDKLEEFNKIDGERLVHLKKILQENSDVEVDSVIRLGSPSAELLKIVEENDIQLVVMGSQGRGYTKELFLGSVSHNIARQSEASVLLIPAKRD